MTIVEQNQSVEEQPVGNDVPSKEKKSVLKMVKDKAKDKMKKISSKLKSPSKGNDENEEEKQELVQSEEEEDQMPAAVVQPKDMSVPLDEYEMLKQKGAENKDDEASAKGGSLGDKDLTEGLPTISLAEQEPEGPSDVLHALPTEYNYKGSKTESDQSQPAAGESETATDKVNDPSASETEPTKDEEGGGGVTTESTDRDLAEKDFSLKTHGENDVPEEQVETPTLTPSGFSESSPPQVSEKSIQDQDSQQPDDVKTETGDVEQEKALDKPEEAEAGETRRGLGLEDVNKPTEEVRPDETSADSKLEDESSVNTANVHDEAPGEDVKKKEPAGGGLETDEKAPEAEESFADAKRDMEPVGSVGDGNAGGERDIATDEKTEELPAGTEDRELSGTEPGVEETKEASDVPEAGEDPKEVSEAPESVEDKKEVSDVPELADEKKEVPDVPEPAEPAEDRKEVTDTNVPEATADDQHAKELTDTPAGTEDGQHATTESSEVSSGPEELSKTSSPGDEQVLPEVSKEGGGNEAQAKDVNPSSKPEDGKPETANSGSFLTNIASKFGYSSPKSGANEEKKKAEQERIVDEKATEVLQA